MTERVLVENCAPTLAGLKTANLVNIACTSYERVKQDVRRLNGMLAQKGVRVIPMRRRKNRMLLYVYRPDMLKRDMEHDGAKNLLRECGYRFLHVDLGVAQLARRMNISDEFPHEVGLFLGYPPEDVAGFMRHKDTGCKCIGDWRVYGDEKQAKEMFARYKKCREIYRRLFRDGKSVEALTVKTSA